MTTTKQQPRAPASNPKLPTAKAGVRTGVKAGGPGLVLQHGVRIRTGVKAGGFRLNHGVRVRTGVKAGGPGLVLQHGLRVRTSR